MSLVEWPSAAKPTRAKEVAGTFSDDQNDARIQGRFVELTNEATPRVHVDRVADLPSKLVETYASVAMQHAWVQQLEDGLWFASIAGLDGLWGDGDSPDDALDDLRGSIDSWVEVRRLHQLSIPPIEGIDLNL